MTQDTSDEVIDLLKHAYTAELETVINYTALSSNLETFDGRDIAEDLEADIDEEVSHAKRVGKRLKILGSEAPTSMSEEFTFKQDSLNEVKSSIDVIEAIDGVLDAEEDAINTYRSLAKAANEAEDYGTANMAMELIQDEEAHYQEFKSLKRSFE